MVEEKGRRAEKLICAVEGCSNEVDEADVVTEEDGRRIVLCDRHINEW